MPLSFTDLTPEIGQILVSISRLTLENVVGNKNRPISYTHPLLNEKSGVFCTLSKAGELRGCIGFPMPEFPLGKALTLATEHSALEDPRFPPVRQSELDSITIEVTVLTTPELLRIKKWQDYLSLIKIGRDGLIASQKPFKRGLLLPQVAVEQKWTLEEFLDHTCMKAGIFPIDLWKDISTVNIERFQGKIFRENP